MSKTESAFKETLPKNCYPYKKPNILPNTLARMSNLTRTGTHELKLQLEETSPEERAHLGMEIYQELANKIPEKKNQYLWASAFFQTVINKGIKGVRNDLEEQGVFRNKYWLECPANVVPGMEITNLNPYSYPEPLRGKIAKANRLFFAEYKFMEGRVLAIGNTKLLLKNTTSHVLNAIKDNKNEPLLAAVGVGSGEELIPFLKNKQSVLVIDHQKPEMVKEILDNNFKKTPIQIITNGEILDTQEVHKWRNHDYPSTIFVAGGIDLSKKNSVDILDRIFIPSLAYTHYVFHEIPDNDKGVFLENMGNLTEGPVISVDCLPTKGAMDVVLGVFENLNIKLPLDTYGAVVTHLVGKTPEETAKIATSSDPKRKWNIKIFREPPNPLLSDLQQALIGRKI